MEVRRREWQQTCPRKVCKSGGKMEWHLERAGGGKCQPQQNSILSNSIFQKRWKKNAFSTNEKKQAYISRNDRGNFQAQGIWYQQTLWPAQKMNTGNDLNKCKYNSFPPVFNCFRILLSVWSKNSCIVFCLYRMCRSKLTTAQRTGGGNWGCTVCWWMW